MKITAPITISATHTTTTTTTILIVEDFLADSHDSSGVPHSPSLPAHFGPNFEKFEQKYYFNTSSFTPLISYTIIYNH